MSEQLPPNPPSENIKSITIEDEMQKSYLDYAMSVIVSRALPDVRDGLKPVHRRILFAMKDGGYDSSKPYRKSARIVGDVMGKYHPHGDMAIYDSMVRMAQPFSMRLPLIDGQGNFGSMDGDSPAAMRYTEARLNKAAETLLEDIDKDTVDYSPNYDESVMEPIVLPARFPNLLVNGTGGIAVGMATNIPPHNLGEVLDACCAMIDNPGLSMEELIEIVPGPDFPTGGQILGRNGILSAYHTGNGSMKMRAKTTIEEVGKREAIIIHEVPYQVNKARLVEKIAETAREKVIEGIADLRDESDRDGVRIVVELKRDAVPDVVLAQLFKYTPMQTNFAANMLALNHGRPQMLNLREIIEAFIQFREVVITRRTIYELNKARDRAHILAGLAVAVANIDEIIALIRNAPDPQTAREGLLAKKWPAKDVAPLIELIDDPEYPLHDDGTYQMSETQAKAILDLRLHRLTGLERDKIAGELQEITDRIREYLEILANREKLMGIMRDELIEIRQKFATPRRTELIEAEFEADIEDLIQREEMVVTVTHHGYIKRVPLSTYRAQKRGGKGRSGMNTKDEDHVTDIFVASTHAPVLFFTSHGIVHKIKTYRLPLSTPQGRGKAIVNLLPLEKDEKISVIMPLPENEDFWDEFDIMFATSHGSVRRNKLSDFKNIRSNGLIAMKLGEGEKLVSVKTCRDDDDVMLATREGKAIRFPVTDIRVFSGRTSTGVRGIKLSKTDDVISMSIVPHIECEIEEREAYLKASSTERGLEEGQSINLSDYGLSEERYQQLQDREAFLLATTTKGYGKRTSSYEYRVTGRGGSGVWNINLTSKNGEVVGNFPVKAGDQIMMVTNGGQLIRMPIENIRFVGRQTQGVTLFKVGDGEDVVSVARVFVEDEEDELLDEEGNPVDASATENDGEAGEATEGTEEPTESSNEDEPTTES